MDYIVRYGIIPSRIIFNYCGPRTLDYAMDGFTEEEINQKTILSQKWIDRYNKQDQFYIKLEASILKEGFRNPLLIISGNPNIVPKDTLPKYMRDDTKKSLVCNINGGSRLWVAQKHSMDVPCIISDFVNMFPNFSELKSMSKIKKYYKDPPEMLKYNEEGFFITSLPHTHLGEFNG